MANARRIAPSAFDHPLSRNPSVFRLMKERPGLSAHLLMTRGQKAAVAILILIGAALVVAWPAGTFAAVNIAAGVFFLAAILCRVALALIGLETEACVAPCGEASEDILPTVTILLPVHDEADGLPILADAIARLDYPKAKLDIKLLLEASDEATIAEARRLRLDRVFDCLIVPDNDGPKTKPKACNYGLAAARGELIVIYDAEDEPEKDQLRKAAAAFARGGSDLACLQARLNFYNAEENLLTRLFALEYALWFDLFLPALERLRLPIPLGGTSNIFRTEILRKVGGWDPFNVTEDADLGLRLARLGYRTRILDSTTFEEANCRLGNWIRQRSRWMKGYMQTWLVHMREPMSFQRAAGWRGFIALQLFVAGNVLSALLSPVLLAPALGWAFLGGGPQGPALETVNVAALIAGNLLFVFLAAIAPARRGWARLVPYAVFAPIYWQLASFAAWRAFFQLFSEPWRWEKTAHALSLAAKERRALALGRLG